MNIFIAVILGSLFGFIMHKAGATNPQIIINMLRLKNLHLMKAILLGIGISNLALFLLLATGVVDPLHVSVKSSYVGVIIGGVLLGIGWAISGFCPGTGVIAIGSGRKDALPFILGGLVGAFIYMLVYEKLVGSILLDKLGGKTTLAVTGNENFPALFPDVPGIVVAGIIAIVFIIIAWMLPEGDNA